MDWNTNEGFGHLKKLGPFDEVSVGGNLSNTFLARHLGEGGAIIATPQILVYETTLTFAGDSVTPTAVMIAEPRRIFTAFGIKAISQWAASEDPLPPFSKALSTHLAKPEIE